MKIQVLPSAMKYLMAALQSGNSFIVAH